MDLRKEIFNKYNGRCAYCGCELKKGWHISKMLPENKLVTDKGEIIIQNDTYENKIPSCAACNMSRTRENEGVTHKTIESFRKQIAEGFSFVQSFPYYQRALRFGLITETKQPVKFYFEKLSSEPNAEVSDKNK